MKEIYNIFVVHGYTANADSNWFPDLKKNLESENIRVHIFNMPHSMSPKEKEWLDFLQCQIGELREKSIFIGHSLGCITILRYLEKLNIQNVESLYLVSGFSEESPIAEISEFVKESIDYPKFINSIKQRYVISAKDDDIIPYLNSEKLAERLEAQFILLDKGKHFIDRDGFNKFPLLIKLVRDNLNKG